jgi:GNAT superfamily N-acetyltransferase
VLRRIRNTDVRLVRRGDDIVGTFALQQKTPWAPGPAFFTPRVRCLYLLNVAVTPRLKRCGIGRLMLDEADRLARVASTEAIRLDAFDGPIGAGPFYERCGYREVGRTVYRGTPVIYYERLLG